MMYNKNRKQEVDATPLEKEFERLKDTTMPDSEIEMFDQTELFKRELIYRQKIGAVTNIQVTAEVRKGKSTLATAIAAFGNELYNKKMTIGYIDADQSEFYRVSLKPEIHDQYRVIDEWNELALLGFNGTTETKVGKYISEEHAIRHINRIACSPSGQTDTQANIFLRVIGTNRKEKITRAILSFKTVIETGEVYQVIGHIDWYVGDIIETDWYEEYCTRKKKKLELVGKEKVKGLVELEESEVIIAIFKKLKKLAKIEKITKDVIMQYVDLERRNSDMPFNSIILNDATARKIQGLCAMINKIEEINTRLFVLKNKKEKNELIESRIEQLLESQEEAQTVLDELIRYHERNIKIKEEYDNIGVKDTMDKTGNYYG